MDEMHDPVAMPGEPGAQPPAVPAPVAEPPVALQPVAAPPSGGTLRVLFDPGPYAETPVEAGGYGWQSLSQRDLAEAEAAPLLARPGFRSLGPVAAPTAPAPGG